MLMNKRAKVWGETQKLFNKNNVEIHRIIANKGGYCSKHYHSNKYNIFYVEKGKLKITIYRQDAEKDILDETILTDGQMTFVEPKLYHKFEAMDDTIAFEIYYSELEEDDIYRSDVGGTNIEEWKTKESC